MAAAPVCTNKTMHAADAPAAFERAEPFPLILFSHCFVGTRFALFSVAERLASLGFVVAAADHTGETLYDYVAGSFELLTPEELELRAGDVAALLDVLLDAGAAAMPADLRGALDADRIGNFGHSFGSMTTGVVTSREPRIRRARSSPRRPRPTASARSRSPAKPARAVHRRDRGQQHHRDWQRRDP